jgi:Protein of unknown function (DUF2939)
MRLFLVISVLLLLAAAAYAAWPLINLYQLVDVVRSGDTVAFEHRVDLPAVRRSIANQFLDLAAEGKIKGISVSVDPSGQEIVSNLIQARLESLITPEIVFELLRGGSLRGSGEDAASTPRGAPGPYALPANPLSRVKGFGFPTPASFRISLGEGSDQRDWLTLTLTLSKSLIWRVSDVDLPDKVFRRLQRGIQFELRGGEP